ncbi:MAG: hypothetical protein SFV32_04270 [Opitutaceae bacterium]|nr:hypothetical protein [Opitutaceae bacterium]
MRVVTIEEMAKGRIKNAVAVLEHEGVIKVYGGPLGLRVLPSVSLSDFDDDSKIRAAVVPLLPDLQSQWISAEKTPEARIAGAMDRIYRSPSLSGFPIDRTVLAGTRAKADGTREKVEIAHLALYWNGYHCAYRPGGGVTLLKLPTNGALSFAHACVKNGDLVEAVLYAAALERVRPGSVRQVAFAGWRGRCVSAGGAAVFSVEGEKTRIFNSFLGDSQLASLPASEAADPVLAPGQVWVLLCREWSKVGGGDEPDHGVALPGTIAERLSATHPIGLPGDTDLLQVKRAAALLWEAGVESRISVSGQKAIFRFGEAEYAYDPELGGALFSENYVPISTKPFLTSVDRLLDYSRFLKGESRIFFDLGEYFVTGSGVAPDFILGRQLLRDAVSAGESSAALALARHLADRALTAEEQVECTRMYEIAARAGFPEAIYNYGARMATGEGMPSDPAEGLAWMLAAPSLPGSDLGIRQVKTLLKDAPEKIDQAMARSAELRVMLAQSDSKQPESAVR